MVSQTPSVFLTGTTGYLGASFLQILLTLPSPPSSITCLIRSESKSPALSSLSTNKTSIKPVIGSFEDKDLLTKLVYEHEVTVETADSDDLGMMKALLEGFRKRKEEGKESIFIHTSGTGTLIDDARGEYDTKTVYTDSTPQTPHEKHITSLPSSAFHRKVDLSIEEADTQGWAKTYIIVPGTIWGEGHGPAFDKGIGNKWSKQIPQLVESSLDRGRTGVIGKGLNVWPQVHIDDLSSLFKVIYTSVLSSDPPHGSKGYYFATTNEYNLLPAAKLIGKTMYSNKWTTDAEPKSFTEEEVEEYFSAIESLEGGSRYYGGTNSRAVAVQGKELGWKPEWDGEKGLKGFEGYVVEETERIGQEKGKKVA